MDAITSFQYLVDSLPAWRDQVTQLTTYTSGKHQEFKAEYDRLISQAKPRRHKSSSINSIHTNDEPHQEDIDSQSKLPMHVPSPMEISPFEAGNRYIYAQATKKRKPGTSFRSGASGPMKFRNKHMVVIYYDSHVQGQLDALVKSLGASRNNLRKGKMAYTLSKGLQLPTLGRKLDASPSVSGFDSIKSVPSYPKPLEILTTKGELPSLSQEVPTGEAAFKQADKDLEICQNLCETAAHQFLRDGDCKLELDTVLKNLEKVSDVANSTLESLKAEEETKKQPSAASDDADASEPMDMESDTTLVKQKSRDIHPFLHKADYPLETSFNSKRPPMPTAISAPPAMAEIEVDDETDQSSIEMDMSKFRTTRTATRGVIQA